VSVLLAMPLPEISRRRQSVFTLSMCVCNIVTNCLWAFHQIYNLDEFGTKDEMISF